MARDTLLACEPGAGLVWDALGWLVAALINFADLRTDPALKTFVYMSQYI